VNGPFAVSERLLQLDDARMSRVENHVFAASFPPGVTSIGYRQAQLRVHTSPAFFRQVIAAHDVGIA